MVTFNIGACAPPFGDERREPSPSQKMLNILVFGVERFLAAPLSLPHASLKEPKAHHTPRRTLPLSNSTSVGIERKLKEERNRIGIPCIRIVW